MRVSFDFDHTLTNPIYQKLALKFIKVGAEVHITTSRTNDPRNGKRPYDNREVFAMADKLGIKRSRITFTNYKDKVGFLKGFDLHFDDDSHEIFEINEYPKECLGVLIPEDNSQTWN